MDPTVRPPAVEPLVALTPNSPPALQPGGAPTTRTKRSPRVVASHGQTSARQCRRLHLTTSGPAPRDSSRLSPGPPLPSSAPSSTSTLYTLSTAGGLSGPHAPGHLSGLQLPVQHTAQTQMCPTSTPALPHACWPARRPSPLPAPLSWPHWEPPSPFLPAPLPLPKSGGSPHPSKPT